MPDCPRNGGSGNPCAQARNACRDLVSVGFFTSGSLRHYSFGMQRPAEIVLAGFSMQQEFPPNFFPKVSQNIPKSHLLTAE
jgi:hypothetical protein